MFPSSYSYFFYYYYSQTPASYKLIIMRAIENSMAVVILKAYYYNSIPPVVLALVANRSVSIISLLLKCPTCVSLTHRRRRRINRNTIKYKAIHSVAQSLYSHLNDIYVINLVFSFFNFLSIVCQSGLLVRLLEAGRPDKIKLKPKREREQKWWNNNECKDRSQLKHNSVTDRFSFNTDIIQ